MRISTLKSEVKTGDLLAPWRSAFENTERAEPAQNGQLKLSQAETGAQSARMILTQNNLPDKNSFRIHF